MTWLTVSASLAGTVIAAVVTPIVQVGNPGNPADPLTGFGAVNATYWIGRFEVTLDEYAEFLNAVAAFDSYRLYSFPRMETDPNVAGIERQGVSGSFTYAVIGDGRRPVTHVNWFAAARYVNWLHNGQPVGAQDAGTTETGAYTLNGLRSGIVSRNPDWRYALPSEDEWYKAAYHHTANAGGDSDHYWLYPTRTNTKPNSRLGSATDPNSGNFYRNDGIANGFNGGYAINNSTAFPLGNALTPVGAFALATSYYGTFDQCGNVYEWNDAVIDGVSRGIRGGAWHNNTTAEDGLVRSIDRLSANPANGGNNGIGFRVVVRGPIVIPALTAFSRQIIDEDTSTVPLPFQISDASTAPESLIVEGRSSDTNLVPHANIVFGGTGSNRTVVVTPAPNAAGATVISIRVRNSYMFAEQTFPIVINPLNDPPELILQTNSASYLEDNPPVHLAPMAGFTDPDSPYIDEATLAVSVADNGTPGDRLEIATVGDGPGQIAVVGDEISYAGITIGFITSGVESGAAMTVALSGATPVAVQALLRSITYRFAGEIAQTQSRTITFVATDGVGGVSGTEQLTVQLLNVPKDVPLSWADPDPIVYGTALTPSQLNAVADVAGTFTYAPVMGSVLGAGFHTLTATFTPADSFNYQATSMESFLVVTPAPLVIAADNQTKIRGATNPILTATISGFVNGDTLASLQTPPILNTLATTASPIGTYAITVTGASSDNYDITFADSTLTILTDDTDGDGIPDAYEVAHGMNANNPADAAADFDGDRFNNLQEYRAGTDPSDSSSALRITSVQVSGQDALISVLTATGRLYQLERTLQFPTGPWNPVGQPAQGDGSTMTITDPSALTLSNAIYRISVTNAAALNNVFSEPAGFQKLHLSGDSDTIVSLPFVRPESAVGIVTSVAGHQLQLSGAPRWTAGQLAYSAGSQPNTYQLLVRSGASEGRLFLITNNSPDSVMIDWKNEPAPSIAANDLVSILPAWSLATLFPGGNGIHPSPSLLSRPTEILLPEQIRTGINLSSSKILCLQSGAWRQIGQSGSIRNDEPLRPHQAFTIRHNVATNTTFTLLGHVITSDLSQAMTTSTNSRHDNLVALGRPFPVSLDNSGLTSSGAFRTRSSALSLVDELLVFDNNSVGKNKSAAAVYYHLASGWHRVGSGLTAAGTNLVFAPGQAVIIRKGATNTAPLWVHSASL